MTDPYSDRTSLCRAYVAGTTVFIGIFIVFIALRVRQPNFPAKLMNSVLLHIYDSGRPIRSNEHLLRHKPYSSTHGHRRVNDCRLKPQATIYAFEPSTRKASGDRHPALVRFTAHFAGRVPWVLPRFARTHRGAPTEVHDSCCVV
jgi:hypothetical protein